MPALKAIPLPIRISLKPSSSFIYDFNFTIRIPSTRALHECTSYTRANLRYQDDIVAKLSVRGTRDASGYALNEIERSWPVMSESTV